MKVVDLEGFETGNLKVIEKAGKNKNGKTLWKCKCSCGNECFCKTSDLTGGRVVSCGHIQKEIAAELCKKAFSKMEHKNGSCLNAYNAAEKKNNSSGIKGVTWYSKTGKWRAQIRFSGKNYHLGLYENIDDAKTVRNAAEDFIKINFNEPDKIKEYLSAGKTNNH